MGNKMDFFRFGRRLGRSGRELWWKSPPMAVILCATLPPGTFTTAPMFGKRTISHVFRDFLTIWWVAPVSRLGYLLISSIKQCTRVNMDDLFTVFHEMGHIYYFLQYRDQPHIFRDGANPGFHEAIGDTFALSASTPKYLESVGLLKDYVRDEETKINELYGQALTKIVFLPFAYSLDQYRWALFRGQVPSDEYNCRFWQMRVQASGITPPVQRYKEDFDPPAKYHVSGDVEYLRYTFFRNFSSIFYGCWDILIEINWFSRFFLPNTRSYVLSFILQFQFHKGACVLAGEYDPNNSSSVLSDCDISGSANAGNAMKWARQLLPDLINFPFRRMKILMRERSLVFVGKCCRWDRQRHGPKHWKSWPDSEQWPPMRCSNISSHCIPGWRRRTKRPALMLDGTRNIVSHTTFFQKFSEKTNSDLPDILRIFLHFSLYRMFIETKLTDPRGHRLWSQS